MRDRRTAWNQDDAGFKAWARLGFEWQRPVLDAFLAHGLPATMPALELRDHIRQAGDYRNQADIWVGQGPGKLRIEVKSVAFGFTDHRHWPYPEVKLDPAAKFWAKTPKPWAYVFVSRKTRAMAACPGNDEGRRGRAYRVGDQERGTRDTWVTMPASSLVSIRYLCQLLAERMAE